MNARTLMLSTIVGLLALSIWFFLGIEIIHREETTDYDLFVKKEPGFTFLFENVAKCGECDLRPFNLIPSEDYPKLDKYCRARLNIDSINACYNQLKIMYPPIIFK